VDCSVVGLVGRSVAASESAGRQIETTSCVFVRMGVAPELWIKTERVGRGSLGVYLPPERKDRSSCHRLCVKGIVG
jgi:hypothetical protein